MKKKYLLAFINAGYTHHARTTYPGRLPFPRSGLLIWAGILALVFTACASYNNKTAQSVTGKDMKPGVNILKDTDSPTGYTATFVLKDDGYESVAILGDFLFAPILTEETDFDNEYKCLMDENGMAIKDKDGKSVIEVSRPLVGERENIKADTLLVDEGLLPVLYTPYDWAKEVLYEGTVTALDHYSGNISFDMEKDVHNGTWIISMPLPSGAYNYSFNVTKGGDTSRILDPVNQEQWYGRIVPSEGEKGFEGKNEAYRQAFARMTESYSSYAYVPFNAEKQVYDWGLMQPVSDKVIEGARLVDVEYKTPTNTYTAPEVAQAYKNGLSDVNGLVDFINDVGYLGVYLPKDYDMNRAEPYKVMYMAHGGRGSQGLQMNYLRIADNAMANGVDDFLIITWNAYASLSEKAWPSWYDWKVLANLTKNIIPFVEETYNVSPDASGRALVGFSAGGGVSHYGLLYYSDWFDYFGIFNCGESTTVPGDSNAYVDYIQSYADYKNISLEDKCVIIGASFYDVARNGGYTVNGTRDAVQTIRYDHTYRAYMGLRDVVGIENLHWYNGHGAHDVFSGSWLYSIFFNEYLWK
jgi:hypothetical protein